MQYLGNKEILQLQKTAFLCSQRVPAEVILKSYDWAKRQQKAGNCIICSNHSPIEKDVFEILLKGRQPLILVLPRSLKKRWEPNILDAIQSNRLLIISPFDKEVKRITRETARIKNITIFNLTNEIMIPYTSTNGQLELLVNSTKKKLFNLDSES